METLTINKLRGMNRFANPLNMSPEWAWDILNGYINRENDIQQRSGIAKYNATAISTGSSLNVVKLFEANFAGTKRMIARCGTAWWKEDGDAVWDSLDGTRVDGAQGQCVMWKDILLMVDGGTPRQSTSAWSVSNIGGSPPSDATAIHVHNGHVIMNSTAAPLSVYVSAYQNYEDYSTANDALTIDLRYELPSGDAILGFATYGEDFLVIICKKNIVIYNAPEDVVNWAIHEVIPTGGVSQHATIRHPKTGGLFIPGIENINILGGAKVGDPFKAIQPYHKTAMTSVTSGNWKYINGGIGRILGHYYMCYPIAGGHEIIVYSFEHNAVVGRYTGYKMHSFCEREDGTIIIGGDSGRAYTMNSGTTDDSAAITHTILTPYYYGVKGRETNYRTLRRVEAVVDHTATFTMKLDYTWDTGGAQTQVSDEVAKTTLGRTVWANEDTVGRGRACLLSFTNDTSGVLITTSRWSLGFIREGAK